tara:strand:+ start:254 stop:505 length:252 start_codon:yes stop_codon:yes gene_type:complete
LDKTFIKLNMGVQKNIKNLQERVEILAGALTRALKDLEQVTTLAQGTLTAFQLHIGEDKWKELVKQLKDLENKNVEQQLEKGD